MQKTLLVIALFFLAITVHTVPAQAEDSYTVPATITPTDDGAVIMADFHFIEQKINIVCFEDGYCYIPIKSGDPTPQPN